MPERDGYIPGVPCWVDTSQPDPEAALPFYRGLFGWEFEDVMPEGSEGAYFIGRIRGGDVAAVGSIPEGAPPMAMWNTYVWVDSADETAQEGPRCRRRGDRRALRRHRRGADGGAHRPRGCRVLRVAGEEPQGRQGRQRARLAELQRPRHARPEAAKAFYGAVFGWQTLALPAGVMWTLPGYGDHLEENTPGLREQMAQMGAPEGFIDVVAALNPIAPDDSETPAHWSVTFAVDDADADRGEGPRARR